MTARPIRYQRQVSDRNGKIFYTSITSLSHISKVPGHEAGYGELDVIKSGKEKHNPDGHGGLVKKCLWFCKKADIMGA